MGFSGKVGGLSDIAAITREPIDARNEGGGETNTPFTDGQSLSVDLTVAADNVKITTGDAGFVDRAIAFDPFFETAATATAATCFPFRVNRRFRRIKIWIADFTVHDAAS